MTFSTRPTTWLLAGLTLLPAAMVQAQMRGGGMPPTPVAAPLDKVPVGSWAEYTISRGSEPARKLRQALVAHDANGYVLETRSENGRGEKTLTRTVVGADPTAEGAVKKVVTQMGDNDPMEMPVGGFGRPGGPGAPAAGAPAAGAPAGGPAAGGPGGRGGGPRFARYLKPDPKTLVGKETVKVAAGSFQTEHYRTENPRGGTVDFWIAKDTPPFGLVKLESDRPAGGEGGGEGGKVTVELAGKGKGAKPELTKPAKPFDPEAMRGRWGGGGGERRGPGGGGGQ